uniref:Uncharacterized protein n=1 Tax=Avena sativa TaxID=4498 RepID=A0ACD5V123_AVESA
MALFRKFFLKKTPDRLLEISERVYVFDCCFSAEAMGEDEYRDYLSGIVAQLQDYFPDASFMVSNFWSGDKRSRISDILSEYDMTVMDYPQQYEGCPLLQLEMIHHFLKSCENWLSVEGQQNMLLMHCERGGWPVLAFMLAGLLLYRKTYTGEQKTLEMVYKQARRDFIQQFLKLNPQPSHLRYLHYVTRHGSGSEWPPISRTLVLDSVVLHTAPRFDSEGGCRPYLRIHGQDSGPGNKSAKVLFEMPKTKKQLRRYGQAEVPVKISASCRVQGDVVLECIHIGNNLDHEETMFRVMFNTAFIQSNVLELNRDDIDAAWNVNNQFPRDFRAEVLFSDPDSFKPSAAVEEVGDDGDETDVASVDTGDEFYEAEEDWHDARKDPESQSTDGRISLEVGNTELDGDASEENSALEIHLTDEDVKIIISENSGSMTNKGPTAPPPSSENSGGLQKSCNVLEKSKFSNRSGQEEHAVQDIQVVAASIGSEGRKFGSNCQEDTKASGFGAAARKSTLKPLHWVKVTRAVQGSLWDELQRNDDPQSVSEFDLSELESLFPAVVPKSDNTSKTDRRKSLGSKPEKVHLIELRRANNTEIMLTKVKMPLPELVNAALALDQSTLDVDQVENLIKFCPTKEEMELLKNYTGDKELLGKCAAVGFRLDSLLKLTDTRATNNKMTLMHYLCKVLAVKSPNLLNFYVDLVSLEATSKIQLKMLAEEMQAVSKGLEKVEHEFKASESDGPVSEVFHEVIQSLV